MCSEYRRCETFNIPSLASHPITQIELVHKDNSSICNSSDFCKAVGDRLFLTSLQGKCVRLSASFQVWETHFTVWQWCRRKLTKHYKPSNYLFCLLLLFCCWASTSTGVCVRVCMYTLPSHSFTLACLFLGSWFAPFLMCVWGRNSDAKETGWSENRKTEKHMRSLWL